MPPDPTICPECGAPLAAGLVGLCPRCIWGDCMAPESTEGLIPGCELGPELARGGMGVVYSARQLSPRRDVAVKMLRPHLLEQSAMKERFRQEAQAAAALQHPGILPVYQVGETDGVPWFTMMLATGGTLAARRADFVGKWRESAVLIADLARAVGHAHERGVLHRDLKPGNILFDGEGRAYVCDFGLAKVATAGETTPDWTLSVQLLGTPHYMPPEVAGGMLKAATTSGDIYALGVILYELLAGRLPFEADNIPALLRKIADEDPSTPAARTPAAQPHEVKPPVARRSETGLQNLPPGSTLTGARDAAGEGIVPANAGSLQPVPERRATGGRATGAPPRDLAAISMKCLEKSPARRYATAAALAEDLEAWLAGKPVTARRLTCVQKCGRWARRNPPVSGLAVLLGLALITSAALIAGKNASLSTALDTSRQLGSEARTNLAESFISEARLRRGSVSLGQREEAVVLLQRAAAQQADPHRLAETASTALATPDLRILHRWPVVPDTRPVISPSFKLWTIEAAMATEQNPFRDNLPPGVIVRRLEDNTVFAMIPARGERRCRRAYFADDQFLALSYDDGSGEVYDLEKKATFCEWAASDKAQLWGLDAGATRLLMVTAEGVVVRPIRPAGPDLLMSESIGMQRSAFSPDGKKVAARRSRQVAVWDAGTGQRSMHRDTSSGSNGLAWSPDSMRLGLVDDASFVINARNGTTIGINRENEITATAIALGPRFLAASAAPDLTLTLWDSRSGLTVLRTASSWQFAQFGADESDFAWMSTSSELTVAKFSPQPWFHEIAPIEYPDTSGFCQDLQLHPDNTILYTRGRNHVLGWSLQPETIPLTYPVPPGPMNIRLALMPGAEYGTFSRKGLGTWKTRSGRAIWAQILLNGHKPDPELMPVPADCALLGFAGTDDWIISTADFSLEAWPGGAAAHARRYFGPALAPEDVFAPDGRWAARMLRKGTPVEVRNDRAELLATLPGEWSSAAVSHDGLWLLTSGPFGYRVWNTRTWQPGFDAPQQTSNRFFTIAGFSRDGTTLAVQTTDEGVTLYELPTGRKRRQLILPQRLIVTGIALTRDARKVYVLSPNFRVHCWDLDLLDAELTRLGLIPPH